MAIRLFDKHIQLVDKSLSLQTQRNALIASNIANRETPGYRAQDLVFERELENALYSDQPGPLAVQDSRHFSGIQRHPLDTVEGQRINSFNPDPRMDGNTVNIDKEMAKLAENQLMFKASVKAMNYKLNSIKSAITEGGK